MCCVPALLDCGEMEIRERELRASRRRVGRRVSVVLRTGREVKRRRERMAGEMNEGDEQEKRRKGKQR